MSLHHDMCERLIDSSCRLLTWKGDFDKADQYISSCLDKVDDAENKARILRLRSRVHWMRGNYTAALGDTILGLHLLGVEVNANPTRREADELFEQVKNEILAVGFEDILAIPRARDPRTDLAIALLNDGGTNAYWSTGEGFSDVIGLKVGVSSWSPRSSLTFHVSRQSRLHCGMYVPVVPRDSHLSSIHREGICSGTALGFFWALAGVCSCLCCLTPLIPI